MLIPHSSFAALPDSSYPGNLSHFTFDLDSSYPDGFPKKLDLQEEDHLSGESYEESYRGSQAAFVPYFAVVVVESQGEDKDQTKFYHTYDLTYFATWTDNITKLQRPLTDPVTGQRVTKIHYFAIKCFESDSRNLFRPIDLSKSANIKLTPFHPSQNAVVNTMLRDALNVNLVAKENNLQRRRTQYLLAEQLGALFPTLTSAEKKIEKRLWLWCSAKGSHQGVVNLFKDYIGDATLKSSPYCDDLLLKTSQISDTNLPRQERNAILEAKSLAKTYGIKKSIG